MENMRWLCVLVCLPVYLLSQTKMQRVDNFGENPRSLRMYVHVPPTTKQGMPLVVVMHGCIQNAKQCARLTDWNKLADENGFVVVYPQQPLKNNPVRCFNWYTENNQQRDKGEPRSIRSMVEHAIAHYAIDTQRIFVTGLSAGAAMTTSMLALYPDIFTSGAVFSGGAYGSASNFFLGSLAMRGWIIRGAENLGNKVRDAYPDYRGNYPTVSVFHGKADVVVNRRNAGEIIKQWTNLHGADNKADSTVLRFQNNKRIRLYLYKGSNGEVAVQYFSIKGMGHAVATDPGKCPCNGGRRVPFSRDMNFFSTYYAAQFFGLINTSCTEQASSHKRCKE